MLTYSRLLEKVSLVTIDESIVAYHPKPEVKQRAEQDGEPIPVVFIPRKPHPNGLEVFLACSYIPHPVEVGSVLPFIIDMIPHLELNDYTPTDIIAQVMHR